MKCLNCGKGQAIKKDPYGYLPCIKCQKKALQYKVGETIEITTSTIKESRKEYAADILQRKRGDTPSLEYIQKYGTKGFTKEEVKNARNVWGSYYQDKFERAK